MVEEGAVQESEAEEQERVAMRQKHESLRWVEDGWPLRPRFPEKGLTGRAVFLLGA